PRPAAAGRLRPELGSVRAALTWYRQRGEAEPMLRLATAMGSFWSEWGHYAEGCEWLRASLALPGADARSSARAGALLQLAWVAQHQGARGPEHAMLAAGIAEALSIYRELSDPAGVARALELSG